MSVRRPQIGNPAPPRKRNAKQAAAITALEKARKRIPASPVDASGEITREFLEAYADYEKAIRSAYRAGLKNHAYVRKWIDGQRSTQDYEKLRDLRSGEEKGRRNLTKAEFWLALEAAQDIADKMPATKIQARLRALVDDPNYRPPASFADPRVDPANGAFEDIREGLKRRLAVTARAFRLWLQSAGLTD